jgi:hypothetical protein
MRLIPLDSLLGPSWLRRQKNALISNWNKRIKKPPKRTSCSGLNRLSQQPVEKLTHGQAVQKSF